MFYSPINYIEPVFRPPSEARSLIFQISIGCSWNRCAFCEMYTSKKFSIKPVEDVLAEIDLAAKYYPETRKIFLADGNALCLPVDKLLVIINYLNRTFPKLTRISAYAIAKDFNNKCIEDIKKLREAGLKLLYIGIESGDDDLLRMINKGETSSSTIESLTKARESGLKLSVMIINGLGGKNYSKQHAENSAKVINAIQPEFLSTLVLSFPYGIDHFKSRFRGDFSAMNILDLLMEQRMLIESLDLRETVFRSDHASNYLVLKGILNRDKNSLLQDLNFAIEAPQNAGLRQEWQCGL